jgi:hypothetical protein
VTIEHERRHRKEERDSSSEIVADAIWLLGERYDVRRKEIEARFPEPIPEQPKNKVTVLKPRRKSGRQD